MQLNRVEALYTRYKDGVFRYAFSILKDAQAAEDVLQEVFLTLLTGNHVIEFGKEQAWLYRVARNRCYDVLRKEKRRPQHPTPQSREEQYRYIDLIACLSQKDQEIITLKVAEGMGYRDIARILGITESSAQKRYQRAIQKLREQEEAHGK